MAVSQSKTRLYISMEKEVAEFLRDIASGKGFTTSDLLIESFMDKYQTQFEYWMEHKKGTDE